MRPPRLLLAASLLGLAGCASGPTDSAPAPIVDRDGFVARLPDRVFVAAPDGSAESARLNRGLQSLGAVPVTFTALPAGATLPRLTAAPRQPALGDLFRVGEVIHVTADFLLLIDASGHVDAVYPYGENGADSAAKDAFAMSLAQLQFVPARIDGTAVPMIVHRWVSLVLNADSAASRRRPLDLPAQVGPVTGP